MRKRTAADAMRSAEDAAARRLAAQTLAAEWGCSERSVYRLARAGGWNSGRAARSDLGERSLFKNEVAHLTQLITFSKRKSKNCIMDTPTAMEVALDSGLICKDPAEVIPSVSTVQRYLRQDRITRAQIAEDLDNGPHISMRSLHPNHVHQFDISPCIQYFFADNGKGLQHRDMKKEFYLGKPEKIASIKRHLLRFVLVDHYSHSFYVQYRYTSGERAIDVAEFLIEAWGPKTGGGNDSPAPPPKRSGAPAGRTPPNFSATTPDNNMRGSGEPLAPRISASIFPLRGVPEMLLCDKGSAAMSALVANLTDALGIERKPHLPGNPRAKGSVEEMMILWERKFESRLSLEPAPDLETLNSWAFNFCAKFNAELILERAGTTRSRLWATIPASKLKLLPSPEALRELLHTAPEERTVGGNLIIKFKGLEFRLADPNLAGRKVAVQINPYLWVAERKAVICVDVEGCRHEAREVLRDAAGFRTGERTAIFGQTYDRHPDTKTQIAAKNAIASPLPASLNVFECDFSQLETFAHLSPRGSEIEIEAPSSPRLSVIEALGDVRGRLGRSLTDDEADYVRARESELTRDLVKQIVDEFLTAETQRREETA